MKNAPQDRIAGVILVGGRASRMGRNKALLPWQGVRLVDVIADTLRKAGVADIYVSGAVEGYPAIPDLLPEQGPVGGMLSSMQRLRDAYTRLLFIPVDMPLLSEDILRILLVNNGPGDARHFHKHPLPCLLRLNKHVLTHTQRIQQWMADGEGVSVKRYLEGLETRTLSVPDGMERDVTNTNTPEQWREATGESAHQ